MVSLSIFKKFLFLKIIFALLSGCLLIQELITFFFTRPTFSSTSRSEMQPHHYPDIVVCPFQGFDQQKLIEAGYWTSYDFFLGEIKDAGGFGWNGSNSTTNNVVHNVTVIRHSQDCPVLKVKLMSKERKIIRKVLKMMPSQISHPSGRCCRGLIPEEANSSVIFSAFIQMMVSQNVNIENYWIHLSDQLSATFFHRVKFNMFGQKLKFSKDHLGYYTYMIQMHEEQHIHNEDLFPCVTMIHQEPYKYHECLEKNFLHQNSKFLNCSPPWMTETPGLWCDDKVNITAETTEFFKFIINGAGDEKKCPPPCNKIW